MSIVFDEQKQYLWTGILSNIVDVPQFNASMFASWLRRNREASGLSVSELARRAEVSKQYISILENASAQQLTNKPTQPSLDKVERIAAALDVDVRAARGFAGYPLSGDLRGLDRPKPQSVAELVERLRDMGFEIQFSIEEGADLGPDALQEMLDAIETNLIMQTKRRKRERAGG